MLPPLLFFFLVLLNIISIEGNVAIVPLENHQAKIAAIGGINNTVYSNEKPLLVSYSSNFSF